MWSKACLCLVVTLLAVTLVEDVAAAPMEAVMEPDDVVSFLQDGEGVEAKLLAPKEDAPKADYSEAVSKGVAKVVDAQADAAKKHVELTTKNESIKQSSEEKLHKQKMLVESNEAEAKTAAGENKAKSEQLRAEGASKTEAKVEEAKETSRKASAKEQVAERNKEREAELKEKQDTKAALSEQKSLDAKRAEEDRVRNEQMEMDAKTEKRNLIADKAKLQAKIAALTQKVSDAEQAGETKTIASFPSKYSDLQSKYSTLENRYMAQKNEIRACAGDKKSLNHARQELDDVPKIKAHMVAQLVSKLQEARALIIKAKESVVKAKGGASQGAIDEVKAADQRIINSLEQKEHQYQRGEAREEQRANSAEAAIGPRANELASKAERQGSVKMSSMQSEVERINGRDHELRNKNSADERKIQGLQASQSNVHQDGVSQRKFNAVKEGLEHKMRVVQRAETREEERAEHDIGLANARASKYSLKLKAQARGVDPAEYQAALSKARSEAEQILSMRSQFDSRMSAEKRTAAGAVRAAEEKAKGVESSMAAHAKEQLLEATGRAAADDSAALARRRSTDSKLEKLLASIQAPAPIPGQSDDVIPANMQTALENSASGDVKTLESQVATKLKHENVETVEAGRTANSEVQVSELSSQLAYKKAALASVGAQDAAKAQDLASSRLRKMTAAQSVAKVREATTQADLLNSKNKLAQEPDERKAAILRKKVDYQMTEVAEAQGAYAKADASTKAAIDTLHNSADHVLEAKKEAAEAKVSMASSVASVRLAKVQAAKIETQKSKETVRQAQAGRVQVEAALEAALMKNNAAGHAKAEQLKMMLTRLDRVIATAQASVEQHRETLAEDDREEVQSASNAKLFKVEEKVQAAGDKDRMEREMQQIIKATDSELNVGAVSSTPSKIWAPAPTSGKLATTLETDLSKSDAAPAMKDALRAQLKDQIQKVMADNAGKSEAELRAILKVKLKSTLAKKIEAMKNGKSADAAAAVSGSQPEAAGANFDKLSAKHQAAQAKMKELKVDLAAVIARKQAAAQAARADVIAHSKAVVAEGDADTSEGREMVASSDAAAKKAVASAKAASAKEDADNKEIARLQKSMQKGETEMKQAYTEAIGTKTATLNQSIKAAGAPVKIKISEESKAQASRVEADLLRAEEAAQKAQDDVGSVTLKNNNLIMKGEAIKNVQVAKANQARSKQEHQASVEKMAADQKAKDAANRADSGAAAASAHVNDAKSPGAAAAAVKAAELAERTAQAAEVRKNEQIAADAAQETTADDQANKEASMSVATAKRNLGIIKQNAADAIDAAKTNSNSAQRAVAAAKQIADTTSKYTEQDGQDSNVQIMKLKESLKSTKDVNKMVEIFDQIQKLKSVQDGKPVAENAAEVAKIRIYKAQENGQKAAAYANEQAEKKIAKNKMDADSLAEQEMKRATDAEARTNERSRKTVDQVRTEEQKKTTHAQAEADKLASSLMHFMNVAHEKIFGNDYAAQKAADDANAKAKSDLEAAQDAHTAAKLAHDVAQTKEAAAAETMSGILKKISADPSDKSELIKLAGEAQAAKTNVIATRTVTQGAAQSLAEKQQVLVKVQTEAAVAAKTAAAQDAKVAKEGKAKAKADEGDGASN